MLNHPPQETANDTWNIFTEQFDGMHAFCICRGAALHCSLYLVSQGFANEVRKCSGIANVDASAAAAAPTRVSLDVTSPLP